MATSVHPECITENFITEAYRLKKNFSSTFNIVYISLNIKCKNLCMQAKISARILKFVFLVYLASQPITHTEQEHKKPSCR